jgi:hypothetical protein
MKGLLAKEQGFLFGLVVVYVFAGGGFFFEASRGFGCWIHLIEMGV